MAIYQQLRRVRIFRPLRNNCKGNGVKDIVKTCPGKSIFAFLLIGLFGCNGPHFRPSNVPHSAVWVDGTFIDCSVEIQSKSNRCTVYKDTTGAILADGRFVLNTSRAAADLSELHYAAYGDHVIYLEDARTLIQTAVSDRDPARWLVAEKLKSLASSHSEEATDCNRQVGGGGRGKNSECALAAFTEKKPFYVLYYYLGVDSFGFRGIAGDSDGNLNEVDYDSMGWMRIDLPKDAQLLANNHLFVMPCPKPSALRKTADETLTCTRPIV